MAAPRDTRPAVAHPPGAPDAEREAVEQVTACVLSFEDGIGTDFRERCNRFYRQYRGFRKWRDAWVQEPRDRDALLYDAKTQWGAHLHIPLSYRTIETLVPAAIAHRPRMLYMPRKERWQENVEAVRLLVDAQQENIDIDLPFQAVMRAGRIYGLGVGKSYWLKEYASRKRVKRRTIAGAIKSGLFSPKYQVGRVEREIAFDDPMFEDVDPFDFMWDPYGSHLGRGAGRCSWVAQRVWMSLEACLDRIYSGTWATESVQAMVARGRVEEELRGMGGRQKYGEVWSERMEASGFGSFVNARGEHPHELIEWHDGDQVFSVLDSTLNVQAGENPCMGVFPFHIYRPTPLQKQMVGIGDMEPLEHLQRELDTMRSQQSDAITLALAAGWIYDSAHVDEEDLVFGPAAAIEVRNAGDVGRVLQRIQAGDIPASSIESQRITRQDFDAVSGMTDALDPSQGGQVATATQAQLVQASLSRRIELGSRRFELEVARQAARCFLRLDQRMIVSERDAMRVPDHGLDMQQAMQEGRWRWVHVGPGGLQGEFEIVPDGGSMAARNVPQDRQDAQMFFAMARDNPHIDARRPIMKGLELSGVRDPESWLKQGDPPVPPLVFEVLARGGIDPRLIQRAIDVAQRADPQLNPGPDVQQVDQIMGGQPEQAAA